MYITQSCPQFMYASRFYPIHIIGIDQNQHSVIKSYQNTKNKKLQFSDNDREFGIAVCIQPWDVVSKRGRSKHDVTFKGLPDCHSSCVNV